LNLANLAISITAVDSSARIFQRLTDNLTKTQKEVKRLWQEGQRLDAVMKGVGKIGAYAAGGFGALAAATGAHRIINGLADAQEGFNKIRVITGKGEAEMEAFRAEIYRIASETATGPEKILEAAISKVRSGMAEADALVAIANESAY